jgi:hypothetical protein
MDVTVKNIRGIIIIADILYIKATCVSVRPSVCHDKQRRAGAGQGRGRAGRGGAGRGGPGRGGAGRGRAAS